MTATQDESESPERPADPQDSSASAAESAAESSQGQHAAESQSDSNAPTADDEKLQQENADLQDRLLRLQAELENYRRRTQKEAAESLRYQSLPVIRDLLPGIDNLHRAIEAAEKSGDTGNLIDGIRMVAKQFQDVLSAHSAELIDPADQSFDPNLHEALSQVPSADHEPMTVIQVVEKGYRIHDRVIRPAKVIVSCAPPTDVEAAAADSDPSNEERE